MPKIRVEPVTHELLNDADEIFASSGETAGCFCQWFVIPVTQYHAGGREQNRRLFCEQIDAGPEPVGLLAYRAGEVVGWCAAGPRSRYARAIKVPSFKGRDPAEDDTVWLVPCFYVRAQARRAGVGRALLEGAVDLARAHAAPAIEGFPFATGAKATKETMVGHESLFASCGFSATRRPSAARVVMRRDLR